MEHWPWPSVTSADLKPSKGHVVGRPCRPCCCSLLCASHTPAGQQLCPCHVSRWYSLTPRRNSDQGCGLGKKLFQWLFFQMSYFSFCVVASVTEIVWCILSCFLFCVKHLPAGSCAFQKNLRVFRHLGLVYSWRRKTREGEVLGWAFNQPWPGLSYF